MTAVMPILTWPTKSLPPQQQASLTLDSVIYPNGVGFPAAAVKDGLIFGDNLAAMWALLPEYEGRIDLIYTDPPFYSNRRYPARVGRGEDSRRPQDWKLAEGYQDNWPSLDAYLDMLYPRLVMMHRLLSPRGTLYLHLDWHASAPARLLLDEIFGAEHLLNEIVWVYHGPSPIRSAFNRKHDTILVYTKSEDYTFNVDDVRQPYNPQTVKTFASSAKAGFGKVPNLERGKVPEDWWYFPVVARLHNERSGYPTQKPEALLERMIRASSNPGDLVADFFCGSGTLAVVAARLKRCYIGVDATPRAIFTTRSRLVQAGAAPFSIRCVNADWTLQQPALSGSPSAEIAFHLPPAGNTVSAHPDPGDILDYWEVDPNWDGHVFQSQAQACRPRRKGRLASSLQLCNNLPLTRAAIRFVTIDGIQGLAFPVPIE